MGLLRGLFGKAYLDPSGLTRDEFRRNGQHAASLFFKGDRRNSLLIVNKFFTDVRTKHGELHFDIGRAMLLIGVFNGLASFDEEAFEAASAARDILAPLGENDFDYKAAINYVTRLEAALSGSLPVSPKTPLIHVDTDIAAFLMDLKA
jgi:hypothetical protein